MFKSFSFEQDNTSINFELDQEKIVNFLFHRPKTLVIVSRERERKNAT